MSVGSMRWSVMVASLVVASMLGCSSNEVADESDAVVSDAESGPASPSASPVDSAAESTPDVETDSGPESRPQSGEDPGPDSGPTCDHYRTEIDGPAAGAKTAGEFVDDLTLLVELSENASPRVRAAAQALFETMGSAPINEAAAALNELVEACAAEGHQALG